VRAVDRTKESVGEFLLIESEGPFGTGCERFVSEAVHLVRARHWTSLFLIENAVAAAVPGILPRLDEFVAEGGSLLVDAFSLHQRALGSDDVRADAELVDMGAVADRLLDAQVKVVWH